MTDDVPNDVTQSDVKITKKAFTIRIEQQILDNLKEASNNTRLRQATQARTYLQMSQFVVTQSNLTIEAYDRTPMGIYPKEIWGNLLKSLPVVKQFEFGNTLGMMVLTNCGIMGIESIEDKMEFLAGLGWFDIRMFQEKKGTKDYSYFGILAKNWPINALHAFLFRILTQSEFPSQLKVDIIQKYKTKSNDQIRNYGKQKKNVDLYGYSEALVKYREMLDGRVQNYSPDCSYYLFNQLKTET